MGCDNSSHVQRATSGMRLVLTSPPQFQGQGLKLEEKDIDASGGHRAFHVRLCSSASSAIEVAFTRDDKLTVLSGHHTLGFILENWYNKTSVGTRCYFSNWGTKGQHTWQLNRDDVTFSPLGHTDVVLGWGENDDFGAELRLVSRSDPNRLCFEKPTKWPEKEIPVSQSNTLQNNGLVLQDNDVYAIECHERKGKKVFGTNFIARHHGPGNIYSFRAMDDSDGRMLLMIQHPGSGGGAKHTHLEVRDVGWSETPPPETALFALHGRTFQNGRKHGFIVRPVGHKELLWAVKGYGDLVLAADADNKFTDVLPRQLFNFHHSGGHVTNPVQDGLIYEIEPRHAPGMRLQVDANNNMEFLGPKSAEVDDDSQRSDNKCRVFKCHQYSYSQFCFQSMEKSGGYIDSHDSLLTQCPLRHCDVVGSSSGSNSDTSSKPPPPTILWKFGATHDSFYRVRSVGHPPKKRGVFNVWECYGAGTKDGTELITRTHEVDYDAPNSDHHRQFRFIPVLKEETIHEPAKVDDDEDNSP